MEKKITDLTIKNAKGRMTIGDGLYLTENNSWRFNYRFPKGGKQYTMTYGQYPEIGLAVAKEMHRAARQVLASGQNPMVEKKEAKRKVKREHGNSFKSVAEKYLDWWKVGKNEGHVARTIEGFEKDIFPAIGHLPINQIEAPHIIAIGKDVEARGAEETARRLIGQIGMCFSWAVENHIAKRNPAKDFSRAKVLKPVDVVSFAAVDIKEVPTLMQKIELYRGTPEVRLALKLLAHTFVRPGKELLGARWDEFDFNENVWVIPKTRTKKKRDHVVPLAKQTIALLKQLHTLTGENELLFPAAWYSTKQEHLSNNTFNMALKRMGYEGKMTAHGFRSVASTVIYKLWQVEAPLSPGMKEDYVEFQMQHVSGKNVRRVYDRNLYLEERTVLMQWWADYLEQASTTHASNVVKFPTAKAS